MKKHVLALMMGMALSTAFAARGQEIEVRSGVVTMMQPVPAAAKAISASTKRQVGGMLGRLIGRAVAEKTGYSYEAVSMATNLGEDLAVAGESVDTAAAYTLLVQFTDKSEAGFQRTAEQLRSIRAGSRVKVLGSGDEAIVVAE